MILNHYVDFDLVREEASRTKDSSGFRLAGQVKPNQKKNNMFYIYNLPRT